MTALIETVGGIATVMAVIGVLANNRRLRWCFIVWMVSNSLTLVIHAYASIWTLLARDVIFLILAVEGWIKWNENLKTENGQLKKELEKP